MNVIMCNALTFSNFKCIKWWHHLQLFFTLLKKGVNDGGDQFQCGFFFFFPPVKYTNAILKI